MEVGAPETVRMPSPFEDVDHSLREQIVRVGRLPPQEAIRIASGIAEALGTGGSSSGRVLVPEDVLLSADGSVKIAETATRTASAARYTSPEVVRRQHPGPSSDLYALGVILYEMLFGAPPFDATSESAILRQHHEVAPPPFPDTLRAALPPHLEMLVFALLDKQPERRPASASVVLGTLRAIGATPTPAPASAPRAEVHLVPNDARPSSARGPRPSSGQDTFQLLYQPEGRRRWPLVLGAVVVICGLAGALGWFAMR